MLYLCRQQVSDKPIQDNNNKLSPPTFLAQPWKEDNNYKLC